MSNDTKIEVIPYNRQWADLFKTEGPKIQQALGDNCIDVLHVGSTAVPGLWAKPIIDIIPIVKDIYAVDVRNEHMEAMGFEVRGEAGMLFRRFFQRRSPSVACNVHVYEPWNGEVKRLVLFRDFLRTHSELRDKYANLKRKLSKKTNDMLEYNLDKTHFVEGIDRLTGYDGLRFVHALSPREWHAYHTLLQVSEDDIKDPKNQKLNHIVMYHGADVVGAATVSLEHPGNIKAYAVKSNDQSLEKQFLDKLSFWLQHL